MKMERVEEEIQAAGMEANTRRCSLTSYLYSFICSSVDHVLSVLMHVSPSVQRLQQ